MSITLRRRMTIIHSEGQHKMLPGLAPSVVSSAPASIVWTDAGDTSADQTSSTYLNLAVGSAAARSGVLIAVAAVAGSVADPSAITVGGAPAIKLVSQVSGNGSQYAGIYYAPGVTGTTATVAITWGYTAARHHISLAAAYDVQSATPVDTATSVASPASLDLDAVAGSIGFGVSMVQVVTSWSWSGLTEDDEDTTESSITTSSASAAFATGGTKTITATSGSTDASRRAAVAVCMR